MATSKAEFEKKIKELEASLAKATSENSKLKNSLEKQEEDWKTRLATAELKLGESEGKLLNLTNRIGLMAKSIWGTFNDPFRNSSFILDNLYIFITFQPFPSFQVPEIKLLCETRKCSSATF